MDVTAVTAQISDIDASLTVPHFDILVDLATREQDQVIGWVETHRPYDGLMPRESHF